MRPRSRAASAVGCNSGAGGTIEAELWSDAAKGFDAKRDVIAERDAELLSAVVNIVATNAACERFVFQLFLYGCGFHLVDAFGRFDERASGEEAGELVASKEGVIERRDARHAGIAGVAEDCVNDLFGVATLAEDRRAFVGVLFRRVMFGVGPALVIEIVEETGKAPSVFVATELSGVGANAGFDGEGMFSQAFALGVFAEQIPGVVSIRHLFLGNQFNSTA